MVCLYVCLPSQIALLLNVLNHCADGTAHAPAPARAGGRGPGGRGATAAPPDPAAVNAIVEMGFSQVHQCLLVLAMCHNCDWRRRVGQSGAAALVPHEPAV